MMTQVDAGLSKNEAYQKLRGNNPDGTPNPLMEAMVDVVSLSDYMLINFYGGNSEFGQHNRVAMRTGGKARQGIRILLLGRGTYIGK